MHYKLLMMMMITVICIKVDHGKDSLTDDKVLPWDVECGPG